MSFILEVSQTQRLKLIGYLDSLHGKHKCLPPWEQQLKVSQKVLFNHELFMQVCEWLANLLYVFENVYIVITRCLPSKDFLSVWDIDWPNPYTSKICSVCDVYPIVCCTLCSCARTYTHACAHNYILIVAKKILTKGIYSSCLLELLWHKLPKMPSLKAILKYLAQWKPSLQYSITIWHLIKTREHFQVAGYWGKKIFFNFNAITQNLEVPHCLTIFARTG